MKHKGFDFRKILRSQPLGLEPVECQSKISPECLILFIQTEKNQKECIKCKFYKK